MASQKKRNDQSNNLNIAAPKLILSTTSYVSIEQSPHEIWDVGMIKTISLEESVRFNNLYLQNRTGFQESFNILKSNLSDSTKDKLISKSIVKFSSRRNLSLMGAGKVWNAWCNPILAVENRLLFRENQYICLFYCLLYSYNYTNGLLLDNRIPRVWLEELVIVYVAACEFFSYNSPIKIWSDEFSELDTNMFYLSSVNYFKYVQRTNKEYLERKDRIMSNMINILKREGLLETSIGSFYFVSDKARQNICNQFTHTDKFSFPSLTPQAGLYTNYRNMNYQLSKNEEDLSLSSLSAYDLFHSEYLVFCKNNDCALKYKTFFEYIENNKKLKLDRALANYQESSLLLYSFLDFLCIRELYKNKSIYYSYTKDWNFN